MLVVVVLLCICNYSPFKVCWFSTFTQVVVTLHYNRISVYSAQPTKQTCIAVVYVLQEQTGMGIEDSSQLPWTTKGKYYLVLLYYIAKRTLSKFFICSLSELKSSLVMDQVLPGVFWLSGVLPRNHPKNVCLGQKKWRKY